MYIWQVIDGSFVNCNCFYFIFVLFQDVSVDKGAGSIALSADERASYIWLEKAEVFISMGLYEPARHFLAEAYRVSVVS